jgi:hypothetical protein
MKKLANARIWPTRKDIFSRVKIIGGVIFAENISMK